MQENTLFSRRRRLLLTLTQAFALLIIAWLWVRALRSQWQHITTYPWSLAWGELALALLALLLQMVVLATAWWMALARMGGRVPWHQGAGLWLRAQIARYIPGGVWDVAGRMVLGRGLNIPTRAIPASASLEIVLQVLSAALFLLFTLVVFPSPQVRGYLPLILAAIAALCVLLIPPVFTRAVNTALRLVRRQPLPIRLGFRDLARLLALYVLAHGLQGVGFLLFARGLTALPWQDAPLLISSYVGAWLVGYVAVFAPTGIGVREGALVLLLGDRVAFPAAAGAALGYRVWLSLRDVLAALLGWALVRLGL